MLSLHRIAPVLAIVALVAITSRSAAQTGACCVPCDPCTIVTEAECLDLDGLYLGNDTLCEDCPEFPSLPEPTLSEVEPADALDGVFLYPGVPVPLEASILRIKPMNHCQRPMQGASVTVTVTSATPFCGGLLTATGITDAEGIATIALPGGGCRDTVAGVCVIKANGVTIRSYHNVKSADFDGASGDGSVSLADLVEFSKEFLDQQANVCHDYDNDENTGLPDLILFSRAFANVNHCP